MNELTITKGQGGLGRQTPNEDNIRGIVMNAGATAPTGLALNTPKLLLSTKDAENIGIDMAYDTTNTVLCYYQIKEFFAENPNGKLWIYLVAQATTMTQMVDISVPATCPVLRLALSTNGEIKQYGVCRNPATTYVPVITTGADGDLWTAIPKAKALNDYLFTNHMPSDIVLEGRSFSGSAGAMVNLRALSAETVRVVFAQDLDVAPSTSNAVIKAHAAVGTFLGTSSKAKVSDSVAWVERYNVSSVADGRWLNVGFSSNTAINTFTNIDLNDLDTKGCIFIRKFVGDTGAYWNEAHSCTLISSDYAYMKDVLTIHKAVRGVYSALLPKLNSPVKVNSDGQLSTEVIASFESTGLRPLDNMQINDEVSEKDIYINPLQNINTNSKLNVKIRIVPIGTARNIEVEIGYAVSVA